MGQRRATGGEHRQDDRRHQQVVRRQPRRRPTQCLHRDVETHVAHALAKLSLPDRVAAVIYAYEHNLVTPGVG